MKKIISLCLVMMLILSMVSTVSAAGATISLRNEKSDDSSFKVIASIKNNPGFIAYAVTLAYDKEVLTATSMNLLPLSDGLEKISSLEDGNKDQNKQSTTTIVAYKIEGDITEDGDLFEVIFKFKDKIPADKQKKATTISIVEESIDFSNNDLEIVDVAKGDSVTVTAPVTDSVPDEDEYEDDDYDEPSEPEKTPTDIIKDQIVTIINGSNAGKEESAENKVTLSNVENQSKVKYMQNGVFEAFTPDNYATRYEVIDALSKLVEIKADKFEAPLSDVKEEYKDIVSKFMTAKIITGYEDKTFKGDNNITRAEFVKVLAVAFNMQLDKTATIDFVDMGTHWSKDYVKTFASKGYTKGYPDGTFKPDNLVTKAEVVAFINRIINADAEATSNIPTDLYYQDGAKHWAFDEIVKVI